jgi:hypothetical protein
MTARWQLRDAVVMLQVGAKQHPLTLTATCSACFIRSRSGDFSEQLKHRHRAPTAGPAIADDV